MAYTKYSLTPANNTATPPDGAPEGMLPSAVNDTMRDMMAQIRDCGDGIRDGTYTMTAPKITGGTITGAAFTGNTFTSPVISGGSINNTPIGATTANTGAFTTLSATGVTTVQAGTVSAPAITTSGDTNTGIFFPAADTIAFTEGGVESMRIDSSGNVGIGTSSPAQKLDVSGGSIRLTSGASTADFLLVDTGTTSGNVRLRSQSNAMQFITGGGVNATIDSSGNVGIGTSSPQARLDVRTTGAAANLFVVSDVSTSALASRIGLGNPSGTVRFSLGLNGTASEIAYIGSEGSFPIYFQTNGTERMRITSGGELLLGASSLNSNAGGARFQLTQNNSNWISYITNTASSGDLYGQYIHYSQQSRNDTGSWFLYCGDNAGQRASFRSNGGLANYSGNDVNLSDAREKTNIELANSYLDKICSIPVKTFNYIDQNFEEDGGLTLGVIAQDVQAVAPELIMESNWGTKEEPKMRLGIYQTDLQYALMKCIQEQQQIINDLKARIETLESK
jgi:hypothetical protein